MKSLKIAKPAEQVNGQDERAAPAVDSSDCPCWWVIKGRQPKVLPPFPIIEKRGGSMTKQEAYQKHICFP